ncbi:IclR family transcriptional regulator [Sphingomonas sp. RS2018]
MSIHHSVRTMPEGEEDRALSSPPGSDDAAGAIDGRNTPGSRTLLRGLDILGHLAAGPLSLAQLTERLALHPATTHRLVSALIKRGFVTKSRPRTYRLGRRMLQLGASARAQFDVLDVARPQMVALSKLTGMSAVLVQRIASDAVIVDVAPGSEAVLVRSHIGERSPLATTAAGIALILDESLAERKLLFDAASRGSISWSYNSWLAEFDRWKRYDVVRLLDEYDDIHSIACPIRDANGDVIAALSILTASRRDTQLADVVEAVRAASASIGHECGWNLPESHS